MSALLLVRSFFTVLGLRMTSICTKYWQLALEQGICVDRRAGCLFVPSIAVVATFSRSKKPSQPELQSEVEVLVESYIQSYSGSILAKEDIQLQPLHSLYTFRILLPTNFITWSFPRDTCERSSSGRYSLLQCISELFRGFIQCYSRDCFILAASVDTF